MCLLGLLAGPTQAAEEAWYALWGVGGAVINYPSSTGWEASFSSSAAVPGVSRTKLSIEMLGFYSPTDMMNNGLIGVAITAVADAVSDGVTSIQLNQYLYALSLMSFTGHERGAGAYWRTDVGFARQVLATTGLGSAASPWGFGGLFGGGYGIPISENTRVLLGLDLTLSQIDGDLYKNLAFKVSGLW